MLTTSAELRAYLSEQATELLGSRAFRQSLEGHLPGEDTTLVTQRLEQIVALHDAVQYNPAPEAALNTRTNPPSEANPPVQALPADD